MTTTLTRPAQHSHQAQHHPKHSPAPHRNPVTHYGITPRTGAATLTYNGRRRHP